jgi:hypothetical protein
MSTSRKKKPATVKEWASVEFEPFDRERVAGLFERFSAADWARTANDLGMYLRLSTQIASKSKAELVEAMRKLFDATTQEDESGPFEVEKKLRDAANQLKAFHKLVLGAATRQFVAISVIAESKEGAA